MRKIYLARYIDYKKQIKTTIEIPGLNYLMIDGKGAPASSVFQNAIQFLYATAYIMTSVTASLYKSVRWSERPVGQGAMK